MDLMKTTSSPRKGKRYFNPEGHPMLEWASPEDSQVHDMDHHSCPVVMNVR